MIELTPLLCDSCDAPATYHYTDAVTIAPVDENWSSGCDKHTAAAIHSREARSFEAVR